MRGGRCGVARVHGPRRGETYGRRVSLDGGLAGAQRFSATLSLRFSYTVPRGATTSSTSFSTIQLPGIARWDPKCKSSALNGRQQNGYSMRTAAHQRAEQAVAIFGDLTGGRRGERFRIIRRLAEHRRPQAFGKVALLDVVAA